MPKERMRLLFVDDDPNVLDGIRRMLHSMEKKWEMSFAKSGEEALRVLAESPFDVVVSDMRMPRMNGAQLLAEIKNLYPGIVRIVLSGHSNEELILRSVGPAHQYLSKPCDSEVLRCTVERTCALRERLADDSLKRLIGKMQSLPSLPTVYIEMMDELASKNCSMEKIAKIISGDVGMTAKILQLVNSAFFGLRRQIAVPAQAINLLGLDTIKALVLSVHIFSRFDESRLPAFSIDALSHHVTAVAAAAKQIAISESGEKKMADDAFMAGMLHDAGKLILAENIPERYAETLELARKRTIPLWQAELELLGTTHAEVGAYLLGLWGFPDTLVEAIMFHHCPADCLGAASFSPLVAVHAANALCRNHAGSPGQPEGKAPPGLDLGFLGRLGFQDRLPQWREACQGILEEAA